MVNGRLHQFFGNTFNYLAIPSREEIVRLKQKADRLFAECQSSEKYLRAIGSDGASPEILDSDQTSEIL